MHLIFQYATVDKQGEKYINSVEFIKNYIGIFNESSSNLDSLRLFSGVVDTNKDGLVYYIVQIKYLLLIFKYYVYTFEIYLKIYI